jgi:hypothetical protein
MTTGKCLPTILMVIAWSAASATEPAIPPINAQPAQTRAERDAALISTAAALVTRAREKCAHQPAPAQPACVAAAAAILRSAGTCADRGPAGPTQ